MVEEYPKTDRNRVQRSAKRGAYDKETVHTIIDSARICHVGFLEGGSPCVIPTLHARDGEQILLHGAKASRLMQYAASGEPVCITCTHVDGLVLARSAFNHSVNYRSAVVFGTGKSVEDSAEKLRTLEMFTERIVPGRWEELRETTEKELAATAVVSVTIESASAKVRTGGPHDFDEDMTEPVWAGVVPIHETFGPVEPDPALDAGTPVPEYLTSPQ